MNIGFFTKQEDGSLVGNLPTMGLQNISLEPVASTKDNSPNFRATVEDAELGAAWLKRTKEGKAYLSLSVVRPGLETVYLAIFQIEEQPGKYVAVYTPRRKKNDAEDAEPMEF